MNGSKGSQIADMNVNYLDTKSIDEVEMPAGRERLGSARRPDSSHLASRHGPETLKAANVAAQYTL